ncbi:hypothetical protein SKAU_G00355940 [Synaphobranchus kaupii]|uniref:Uncharacterized protein n=1 Tax=Synaphobranchus kaupii TaxID=118154 RepID=A0A9Q1EHC4_SYNKA|nr:hypothetical protein SKAU_G00355940 [Synaphobranchus kaupii]
MAVLAFKKRTDQRNGHPGARAARGVRVAVSRSAGNAGAPVSHYRAPQSLKELAGLPGNANKAPARVPLSGPCSRGYTPRTHKPPRTLRARFQRRAGLWKQDDHYRKNASSQLLGFSTNHNASSHLPGGLLAMIDWPTLASCLKPNSGAERGGGGAYGIRHEAPVSLSPQLHREAELLSSAVSVGFAFLGSISDFVKRSNRSGQECFAKCDGHGSQRPEGVRPDDGSPKRARGLKLDGGTAVSLHRTNEAPETPGEPGMLGNGAQGPQQSQPRPTVATAPQTGRPPAAEYLVTVC